MLHIIRYNVGPLDNNTYVLVDLSVLQAAVVDPSFDSAPIWNEITRRGWKVTWVLNTHAHLDHVVENAWFVEKTGAPLALHPADIPLLHRLDVQSAWLGVKTPRPCEPTHLLTDGETIPIGNSHLNVIHTPGHSPGSVSFAGEGFVLTGDALFAGSIGRTDLPGGNMEELLHSLHNRLLTLPEDTRVYPGHGPETTIGQERRMNPFLCE
jgi:glyoxylase-like metal-dependent hydrolase (beta-lactamase superfamily II)